MTRRKFVCGNWKMHKTAGEAVQLIRELRQRLDGSGAQVAVAPPFTALPAAKQALQGSTIQLFAQNCHHEKQGAFTGEVSASMLKDVGCDGVILGHSERRQYFGETDEWVAKKLRAALAEGLHPIVCVGETLQEREGGKTWEVVSRELGGAAVADAVRIQYGGSVKPDNAADLLSQPDVDGALVGGASLKAADFAAIVAAARS